MISRCPIEAHSCPSYVPLSLIKQHLFGPTLIEFPAERPFWFVTLCQIGYKTYRWTNSVDCGRVQDCNEKIMLIFCRNLYYFKCWCIADHQSVWRLTSHNTHYIGCVCHSKEASKTQTMLPQLLMSTKQIPIITVGLRWNGHHWNFLTCFFRWKIRWNKSCHTNLRNFLISFYEWKWTIQRWNSTSCISRTRFKFSSIVSKSDHSGLGGRGRVLGLRLTMLPLFT